MKQSLLFFTEEKLQRTSVSSGALLFIVRWLSISIILFSSEILIRYGLMGLIGFIILFAISLSIFGYLGQRLRLRFDKHTSLLSVIQIQSTGWASAFYKSLVFMLSLSLLLIQFYSVHLMLITLFNIPTFFTQSLFLLACFIYFMFSSPKVINRIEPIFIVMIVFMVIILIPVYNFVQKGITPVFNGIWLYHPYILFWKTNESTSFFITIFLLLVGIILLDFVSWNRIFSLQIHKINRTTSMSAFLLAMIFLGLSSLLLIALSNKSFRNPSTIIFSLVEDLQTPLLQILFFTFSMIISFSIICIEMRFISTLFLDHTTIVKRIKKYKIVYPIAAIVILAVVNFLFSFLAPLSITNIFMFYGVVCTALIPVILSVIFSKTQLNHLHMFSTMTSIVTGFIFFWQLDEFVAIWASFGLSTLFTLVIWVQSHIRFLLQ